MSAPITELARLNRSITNCIDKGMAFAETAARSLPESERGRFYLRLAYRCLAQALSSPCSFTVDGNRNQSVCVIQTADKFEELIAAQNLNTPEHKNIVYKALFFAITVHARTIEAQELPFNSFIHASA